MKVIQITKDCYCKPTLYGWCVYFFGKYFPFPKRDKDIMKGSRHIYDKIIRH